jgi:hypothetical protein
LSSRIIQAEKLREIVDGRLKSIAAAFFVEGGCCEGRISGRLAPLHPPPSPNDREGGDHGYQRLGLREKPGSEQAHVDH